MIRRKHSTRVIGHRTPLADLSPMRDRPIRRIGKVKRGIDDCIKIDIDTRQLRKDFEAFLLTALHRLEIIPLWIRYDKTRRGWHIVICPTVTMDAGNVLLSQAILCCAVRGDWNRETFNFRRWIRGIYLNVLFEVTV